MNTTRQPARDALSSLRTPLDIREFTYGSICSLCQTLLRRNSKYQRETVDNHVSRMQRIQLCCAASLVDEYYILN